MKKVLIFVLLVSATGFSACTKEEPVHVHRTRTVYRERERGPYVGTPTGESAETFRANTKPDSY